MTTDKWERGEAPVFWMEDEPPTGTYDYYIFDTHSHIMDYHYVLMCFMSDLGIFEFGTIYETIDCIRIKVRDVR